MKSSTPRWCDPIAPVTVAVTCSGTTHHVTWRRGKLVLEDHDLAAELALLALDGHARPACVQLLEHWRDRGAWDRHSRIVTIGFQPRRLPPAWPLDFSERRLLGMVRRWERERDGKELGAQLRRRAMAPLLDATVAAARANGCGRVTSLDVELGRKSRGPTVQGWLDGGGGTASVSLLPEWLYRVWARDLAVIDGQFVVDVVGDHVEVIKWHEDLPGAFVPRIEPL